MTAKTGILPIYLAGAYQRGHESWPVFDLFGLVESSPFLQAAAD